MKQEREQCYRSSAAATSKNKRPSSTEVNDVSSHSRLQQPAFLVSGLCSCDDSFCFDPHWSSVSPFPSRTSSSPHHCHPTSHLCIPSPRLLAAHQPCHSPSKDFGTPYPMNQMCGIRAAVDAGGILRMARHLLWQVWLATDGSGISARRSYQRLSWQCDGFRK